jgi:hypothetical protein
MLSATPVEIRSDHPVVLVGCEVHVYLSDPTLEARLMSLLGDKIKAATDSAALATDRVTRDVAALRSTVADLQARVDAGGSPEDLAALDALKAQLDGLDPTVAATLPDGATSPVSGTPLSG